MEREITNCSKRVGEVSGIAFGRKTEIVGVLPPLSAQGTPSREFPFTGHSHKCKRKPAGIARCWET